MPDGYDFETTIKFLAGVKVTVEWYEQHSQELCNLLNVCCLEHAVDEVRELKLAQETKLSEELVAEIIAEEKGGK